MDKLNVTKKIGTIRVRANQIEMIVDAMEKNPFLNSNKYTATYTAAKRNEDWDELSRRLNVRGGAIKCIKTWQKTWSDKKTEVKRRNRILQAEREKNAGERNEELKLTSLEERILRLIGMDTTEIPDVENNDTTTEEFVIPRIVKVEECAVSPDIGSSYVVATPVTISQPLTHISNSQEHFLPDTPSILPDTPSLLSDTLSRLSSIEELHQPESVSSQSKVSQSNTTLSEKPTVFKSKKSDEKAQREVEGETEVATALTRIARALEKKNELQERALDIQKRKAEVLERSLAIKKQKADTFVAILSLLKEKL